MGKIRRVNALVFTEGDTAGYNKPHFDYLIGYMVCIFNRLIFKYRHSEFKEDNSSILVP